MVKAKNFLVFLIVRDVGGSHEKMYLKEQMRE